MRTNDLLVAVGCRPTTDAISFRLSCTMLTLTNLSTLLKTRKRARLEIEPCPPNFVTFSSYFRRLLERWCGTSAYARSDRVRG